jgi:hypothetical protein
VGIQYPQYSSNLSEANLTVAQCKIRDGYGLIGGKDAYVTSSCQGVPQIKIVLIEEEIHYVSEDHIVYPTETGIMKKVRTLTHYIRRWFKYD